MCGICGVLGPRESNPNAWVPVVRDMASALTHRGPDDDGLRTGRGHCLGFRRLSIIDLEHGQQPMCSDDDRYALVFNGEIYNYVELRAELEQEGEAFRTASDTEVLLRMLIRYGVDALLRLNGMFAFAFVDQQTGDWILARDPFGIKPLYFAERADAIVFASEIKALLLHPEIDAELDWEAAQQYFTFQFCLDDATLFRGVRTLEPGHYLTGNGCDAGAYVRYWDLDYGIDDYHTEEYFVDELRTLLADSARLQIRSDVPLGAYLSGGWDSSAVSTFAVEHIGESVKMFHGHFDAGRDYDESEFARAAAEHCGGELLTTTPTPEQFIDDLPHLIRAMDEPAAGPGLFPQYRVSKLASQHVKVVLGGQGGDEVFGGYARYLVGYLEQALKGAIFGTQEEGKHVVTLSSIVPNLRVLEQYVPLLRNFWQDGLFEGMDRRYFRLLDRSPDLEGLLTGDAFARFDRDAVFGAFERAFNRPDTMSYINKMTHFDQKTLLPALLQVEDRVSMAVSLESRVPLLDTRIAQLVASAPPSFKFRGGQTRYLFRQAVQAILPDKVVNRTDKMGFPVPLRAWMDGPVGDFVSDVLLSQRSKERGLFAPKALERLIRSESKFGRSLWGALCLELWHREFIDGA